MLKSHTYLCTDVEQVFNAQFQRSTLIKFKNTFATLKADLLGDMTLQILIDVYDFHKFQKEWEIHANRKHLGLLLSTVTSEFVRSIGHILRKELKDGLKPSIHGTKNDGCMNGTR